MREGTSLKVKIAGYQWVFPTIQNGVGWEFPALDTADFSRVFTVIHTGEVDFEIWLQDYLPKPPPSADNLIHITVFENDATEASWSKVITVN